jgi:hypothetical protein
MKGKPITRLILPLLILVVALGMSLEGAHAFVTSGMPYGEGQPLGGSSAYYYNGRTYVTWQGPDLDPYVAYYDSATKTWTGPVRVGDNPLTNDDHGPPVILVDNSGYIHVMYGSHGTALKYVKSTNPEDISAWAAMLDPVSATRGATYINLVLDSSGNILLIYRSAKLGYGGAVEDIIKSTDGGATWSAPQDMIDVYAGGVGIAYVLWGLQYEASSNKIHLAWVRDYGTSTSSQRKNLYYAYLNLTDNNMYSISGTNLGTTINQTEADANCKVVDSGNTLTNLPIVRIDSTGKPYIIYIASTNPSSPWGWKYNFTRWTGAAWSAPVTITTTDDYTNCNEFFVNSSTNIEAYLVGSGNPGRGGDIEKWSWDGSTWSKVATILRETDVGGTYGLNMPVRVANGGPLKIVFNQVNVGVNEYTISNLRIFAYYDGNQLIVKRRS